MTEHLMDFDALHGQGATNGPVLSAAPWQLDEPQPLIVELADQGPFAGPVPATTPCSSLPVGFPSPPSTSPPPPPFPPPSPRPPPPWRSPSPTSPPSTISLQASPTVLDKALMHYLSAIHCLAAPSALRSLVPPPAPPCPSPPTTAGAAPSFLSGASPPPAATPAPSPPPLFAPSPAPPVRSAAPRQHCAAPSHSTRLAWLPHPQPHRLPTHLHASTPPSL